MKKLRKVSKTTLGLLALCVVLGSALAVVLYTLDVPNSMRLQIAYNLEFTDSTDTVILSYDWGEFLQGQKKKMCSGIGTGFVRLHNVGNMDVHVTWIADLPSQWALQMPCTGGFWVSGDTKPIVVGAYYEFKIELTEVSAVVGVDYTFTLSFQIVE